MTEVQKRFEADAYKQKMNYAGSAGIAAEQGFLAGMDRCLHLLQQHNVSGSLPPEGLIKLQVQMCVVRSIKTPATPTEADTNALVDNLVQLIKFLSSGGNDR